MQDDQLVAHQFLALSVHDRVVDDVVLGQGVLAEKGPGSISEPVTLLTCLLVVSGDMEMSPRDLERTPCRHPGRA